MTADMMGDAGSAIISVLLLTMLFVIAASIARLRNLFAIVMLSGIYSLICAVWYVLMDAVDVGFTEAAVGAGMSTAVLLGAILLTARTAKPERRITRAAPLAVCVAAGTLLLYGTSDLPPSGDPASPANTGAGLAYLQINWHDTGVPNVVTSVLASYRGLDTLGEAAVVFAAGLAVVLLLGFGERSLAETLKRAREQAKQSGGSAGPGAAP